MAVKQIRDHFARIDARSLGLFRLAMGLVLIGDLFARWRWARDFYSNEGVLPNHNHLFNLRGKEDVFSVFHAFSSPGEAHVALGAALVVYVFFLIGYRTRVFHVLSLVFLVSLASRNILTEGAGSYAAIALLAFTVFLPCGSRFSLDSLRASMALRDEQRAADLNDRPAPPEEAIEARRSPGWSPASVAAFGVLLQIAVIYACSALQKSGAAWRDGSALHYALHVDRWVSGLGASAREVLASGALRGWTFALRYVEIAVPALLIVPALFRWTRLAAAALMVVHGLTLGLLFEFGLYGWSLVAAAALVVPREAWDALEASPRARGARTLIYDADCGVCLWICRLLRRADLRGHLVFQGNDALDELLVRGASGKVERAPMPKEVTTDLVSRTVVAVDGKGRVFTRGRAVVETVGALPLGWLALPLRLPVLSHLLDAAYDAIASRRHRISALMGKDACPITPPPGRSDDEEAESGEPVAGYRAAPAAAETSGSADAPVVVAPARRSARLITGFARELAAALVVAAMLAQTVRENPVPQSLAGIPQGKLLAGLASWPRMLARWNLLAPEPPRENGTVVVDAQTRGGEGVDPFTGAPPETDLRARGPLHLGAMWSEYLDRVRKNEWEAYQRAFRDYLAKGGPMRARLDHDPLLTGLDAYWVTRPIPAPGVAPEGEGSMEKLFSHSRGGAGRGTDKIPMVRPTRP